VVWVVQGDASGVGNHDSPADIDAAIPVRDLDLRAGREVANAHRDGQEVDDATIGIPPDVALRVAGLVVDWLMVVIVTTPNAFDHPFHPRVKHFVAAEWVSHF